METNIFVIVIISLLLIPFFTLPVYISSTKGFVIGLIVLAVQVVISVTAYQSFTTQKRESVFIAYEKGREAATHDTLD